MKFLYNIYWFITRLIYGTRIKVGKHAKFRWGGVFKEVISALAIIFLSARILCWAHFQRMCGVEN